MRPPLPPGPYLVVGLARSGRAAALALQARGGEVTGTDGGAVDASAAGELERAGVRVHAETDGVDLLAGVKTLIKSPGVPQEAAVVRAARERGVVVLGELELGWRLLPNPVIAITGSNGKTTTTELIGQIHREAGAPVAVAGNVGTALTTLPGALDDAAVIVLEASSFQLEDTLEFAPDAAVLLNLAPDHLDRHGSFEAYRDAKLRIFAAQSPDAIAVVPAGFAPPGRATRVTFASPMAAPGDAGSAPGTAAADMTLDAGRLVWRGEPLMDTADIRLRGAHNVENAMAAAAVTLARGIDPAAVRAALAGFAGVEHRLEEVARVGDVLYVDDSKATNVASAVVGIRSFAGGVHVILGGRGKQRGLRAARRGGRGALPRRVPDRRGGGAARRPRWRHRRRRPTAAGTSTTPWPPRGRPPRRARSSCCRPPAPPTTSTARSTSAATSSRRSRRAPEACRASGARGATATVSPPAGSSGPLRDERGERHVGVGQPRIVDRRPGAEQRLDVVADVPQIDVHAREQRVPAQPEGDELAARGVAAEDDAVPVGGVAAVLHPDVVLVGEEVRQPVVGRVRRRSSRVRRRGPARARWPSARPGSACRRTDAPRVRRRRPRRRRAPRSRAARR